MSQAKQYLDGLSYEEQNVLLLNLTDYAVNKARGKFWRTGNSSDLPDGETASSVVSLAFERVLTMDAKKKRNWNPETHPDFYKYMSNVIDSLLFHLSDGQDNKILINENNSRYAVDMEQSEAGVLAVAEKNIVAATATKKFENSERLIRIQLSPEEELIAAEEKAFYDKVLQDIRESVADDKEASAMIEAMDGNYIKSREIAQQTGIDIDEIYKARKRLNTVVTKVKQKFNI